MYIQNNDVYTEQRCIYRTKMYILYRTKMYIQNEDVYTEQRCIYRTKMYVYTERVIFHTCTQKIRLQHKYENMSFLNIELAWILPNLKKRALQIQF